MEPIVCPETSVRNYHYSPRNNPEERGSRLLRGGSLKSRIAAKDRQTYAGILRFRSGNRRNFQDDVLWKVTPRSSSSVLFDDAVNR